MYRPQNFAEDRPDVLVAAMREIGFAALVTPSAEGLAATHAPMLVHHDEASGRVVIEAHIARANPHWKAVEDGAAALAIFQGPSSYVTPSWYPSKAETGKVVPTWVYIAVHAHGQLRTIHDAAWLHRHVGALTDLHETGRAVPWQVEDAPESFVSALVRGIVGLELTVERLEGAWKLNQHKAAGDREGTRAGLAAAGPAGQALAHALADR